MKTRQVFERYDRNSISSITPPKYCPKCGKKFDLVPQGKGYQLACKSCRFILYKNPYPGVVILINDHEKILLGKELKTYLKGENGAYPEVSLNLRKIFICRTQGNNGRNQALNKITSILNVVSNFFYPRIAYYCYCPSGRKTSWYSNTWG